MNDGGFGETTHHQPSEFSLVFERGTDRRTQRRRNAAISERSERTSRQESDRRGRMDAAGFFRDATPAVNSRMTGLVALMAAATSMKKMYAPHPEQIASRGVRRAERRGFRQAFRSIMPRIKSPEHPNYPASLVERFEPSSNSVRWDSRNRSWASARRPFTSTARTGNMLRRMQMITTRLSLKRRRNSARRKSWRRPRQRFLSFK